MVQSVNNLQRGVIIASVPEEEAVVKAPEKMPQPLVGGSYAERVGLSSAMIRWHFERRMQANVKQDGDDPCAKTKCEPLPNKYKLFVRGDGDPDEVALNDIWQGVIGDCYLMAALGAIARRRPALIKQMISEVRDAQGNVTAYKVALYKDGKRVDVTVDAKGFPKDRRHAQVTGDRTADGADEIWPLIIEKAYAKLRGGYDVIGRGGDPGRAMSELLGTSHRNIVGSDLGKYSSTDLERDLKQGHLVILSTRNPTKLEIFGIKWVDEELKSRLGAKGLAGNHAYVVTDVTEEGGIKYVHLYNPWGREHPKPLPYEEVKDLFYSVSIGSLPEPTVKGAM